MAVGLAIAGEAGQYNGRMTPFVILSCMMAAIGGVILGYTIGISGGVTSMEPFLEKLFPEVNTKMKSDTKNSNYCKFDSELLTSFTSSLYIAGLVASLLPVWSQGLTAASHQSLPVELHSLPVELHSLPAQL
ncbi:hypothetical protein PS1_001663 [Malus domestica]